jgi:hypothetical protein
MNVTFRICMQGKSFYPFQLEKETGIIARDSNDPGSIGSSGRYRNKPIPYGYCHWEFSSDCKPYGPALELAISSLEKHIGMIREFGAENVIFQMYVEYEAQCNLEYFPEQLRRLSSLNVPLTISCYYTEPVKRVCP